MHIFMYAYLRLCVGDCDTCVSKTIEFHSSWIVRASIDNQ